MATLTTKFDVGQVVWRAGTTTEQRSHPCPDCLGSREWVATSPAGAEFKVPCPRCSGSHQANRDLSLTYAAHAPSVSRLTIGLVKASSQIGDGFEDGNSYMCLETGVGSGSIYREADLFATEEEALVAAKAKAAVQNADKTGWVAKQYEGSLKFCDYELRDASIKAADALRINAQVRARMLVEDLQEAEDFDDVKRLIATWNEREEAA